VLLTTFIVIAANYNAFNQTQFWITFSILPFLMTLAEVSKYLLASCALICYIIAYADALTSIMRYMSTKTKQSVHYCRQKHPILTMGLSLHWLDAAFFRLSSSCFEA